MTYSQLISDRWCLSPLVPCFKRPTTRLIVFDDNVASGHFLFKTWSHSSSARVIDLFTSAIIRSILARKARLCPWVTRRRAFFIIARAFPVKSRRKREKRVNQNITSVSSPKRLVGSGCPTLNANPSVWAEFVLKTFRRVGIHNNVSPTTDSSCIN